LNNIIIIFLFFGFTFSSQVQCEKKNAQDTKLTKEATEKEAEESEGGGGGLDFFQYKDFSLGAGLGLKTPKLYRVDSSNTTNSFDTSIALKMAYRFSWFNSSKVFLLPALNIEIPRSGDNDYITYWPFNIDFQVGYKLKYIILSAGVAWDFHYYSTSAATISLNNGSGTSNFYMTDDLSIGVLIVNTFGAQVLITKKITVHTNFTILKLLDSKRRNYKSALTLNYHFGAIDAKK
jgi:hypothetical protein